MKTFRALFKGIVLFFMLGLMVLFTTCEPGLGYREFYFEEIEPVFKVTVRQAENGSLKAIPNGGKSGTEIMLVVNPAPGYRLKDGSLARAVGSGVLTHMADPPYRFNLDNDNVITGEFEAIPVSPMPAYQIYGASAQQSAGGSIALFSQSVDSWSGAKTMEVPIGMAGKEIIVYFYPDAGYTLKEGSVKWAALDSQNAPGTWNVLAPPYIFNLPSTNVLVQAEFEKPSAASAYLTGGKNALLRGDYDGAASAFETAWKMDPQNSEAIFYSTLGKLASIAVSPKVRQLMSTIGLSSYPGNLNNLLGLGDSWYSYEYDDAGTFTSGQRSGWLDSFSGVVLPKISKSVPGYYVFQNQINIVNNGLDSNGHWSIANWYMVLFFNLMSTRIKDLNNIADDALKYIYNDVYETAAARAATLNYGDTFVIDQGVIDKLYFDKWLTDGDRIGRAELDILFGHLNFLKACLEWVSAYDMEFERYLFRFWSWVGDENPEYILPVFTGLYDELKRNYVDPSELWGDSQGINYLVNKIAAYFFKCFDIYFGNINHLDHNKDLPLIPGMLPLRNHFLKTSLRAGTMIGKSKTSLSKACDLYVKASDYYFSATINKPQIIKDELTLGEKNWYGDFLAKLRDAVKNGGSLYYPDAFPTSGNTWNYSMSNAENGINFGKLFTAGQLSLEKMFVTETGGKLPKFYGWDATKIGEGTFITKESNFDNYEWAGFKFDLTNLKQVFVKGLRKDSRPLNDIENVHAVFPDIIFTSDNAKYLHSLYYEHYHFISN